MGKGLSGQFPYLLQPGLQVLNVRRIDAACRKQERMETDRRLLKLPLKLLALPLMLALYTLHIIGKLASNLSAYVVGLFMLVILASCPLSRYVKGAKKRRSGSRRSLLCAGYGTVFIRRVLYRRPPVKADCPENPPLRSCGHARSHRSTRSRCRRTSAPASSQAESAPLSSEKFMLVILACGIYQVCVREWLNVAILFGVEAVCVALQFFAMLLVDPEYSLPRQPTVRQGCRVCRGFISATS